MSLLLEAILSAGDLEHERVVLRIKQEEIEIGDYAILSVHADGEYIFGGNIFRGYWFADITLKPGDTVVLYSKKGKQSEKTNKNGSKSVFFYWGLDAPHWKHGANAALVVNIDTLSYVHPLLDDSTVEKKGQT